MKTTIEIPDALLEEARRTAAREGTSVRALIIEALHRLIGDRRRDKPFRLRDASFKGRGLSPEFADASWSEIRDATYKGRGS
jgi:hypothetical protein